MRVFGFHDNSACGYYRITLPLDYLATKGWEIQTACGWDERALGYPVVIGQRIGKAEALTLWRKLYPGRYLIYETDDDMWSIDPTNLRAMTAHGLVVLDAAAEAARMAHAVTVSTEPLAQVLRQHNENVTVLPNHIDGRLLQVERPRRERVTVGWAGGDSHLGDWQLLAPHLKRFLKRNPQVDLHVIGTDFAQVFDIPHRVTGWQDVWSYYRTLDFDIGLAPLADTPFNCSKSPIKALEYAALGIPVIASAVGPYADFVLDGVTGILVRTEHEWGRYLRLLAGDAGLRAELGAKAKEHAAEWTIQHGWRRWADVYEQANAGRETS